MKPKKEKTKEPLESVVKIPPIDFGYAKITLVGETPLIVNKMSEKARQQMLDKQMKRGKQAKEAKDPQACFEGSLYRIPGKKNKFGIPAGGVKQCAVSACRFIDGVPMTVAQGAFHVLAGPGNLIEIDGDDPVIDESIVRVGKFPNKVADIRYRGRFDKWSVSFSVKYNKRMISVEQLANLFDNAGFSVGLCEWRPEKKGTNGMFKIQRS